jgi:hypothetical protein
MQKFLQFFLLDVYLQLNMFSGVLTPIIRSSTTAVARLVLPSYRDDSSAVGRGQHSTRTTSLLPPRSDSKPEAATAVVELLMMDVRTPETC